MWIARDQSGELYIYPQKPIVNEYGEFNLVNIDPQTFVDKIDDRWFPELTFGNSPQEVTITEKWHKYPDEKPKKPKRSEKPRYIVTDGNDVYTLVWNGTDFVRTVSILGEVIDEHIIAWRELPLPPSDLE